MPSPEDIIRDNQGLVYKVALKYKRFPKVSIEDLVQEGNLGLLHASRVYDPSRGAFSTCATWWVRHYVCRYVQKNFRTIRLPAHIASRRLIGHDLKPDAVSLSCPIGEDITLEDLISERGARAEEPDIQTVIDTLIPSDKEMLEMRFGFNGPPRKIKQIAEHFGMKEGAVKVRLVKLYAKFREILLS